MESKRSKIADTILKNQVRTLMLLDLKTYIKTTITNTVLLAKEWTNRWNRKESPERDLQNIQSIDL